VRLGRTAAETRLQRTVKHSLGAAIADTLPALPSMGSIVQAQDLAQLLSPPPDLGSAIPLALVIMLTLAVVPAVLARMKGHNPVLWYLYGCVFFPGALLQAVLLPNNKRRQASLISQADELERWARLRSLGLLTEAEFEEKKRQLLQAPPGSPSRLL
jgi:hypothetical protein